MWHPEPGWQPLRGGASSGGVWLAVEGGRELVVKRLVAPTEHDPREVLDPRDVAYWRRSADAALDGALADTPGLVAPATVRVEEDDEGITLVHERVAEADNPGLFLARALGAFAGAGLDRPWLARGQLRSRLRHVEHRGGWPTLARTTVADVAAHLWSHRASLLDTLDGLPQVVQHGDPVPANLAGRAGEDRVVAIDWATLGTGPVGADVGYYALMAREEFDHLVDAYADALPPGLATHAEVTTGARITAVYTVLNRAEWALARAAQGEGALAGKFRHPSVAPYLRAMQRQFPQIEALLR